MSDSLTVLLRQVRGCRLCAEYLPLGPRPVLQAAGQARILVVGQAPGIRVHQSGLPFDDPSGDRLRKWMGIDRATFYNPRELAIVPMGFCYPGTGPSGDLPPRPECAPQWRQLIMNRLPGIQLTVLLGQYAHRWHLKSAKGQTLTERVRAWRQYWPTLLPLPHPSPRNNIWLKKNRWFEEEVVPMLSLRVKEVLRIRPDKLQGCGSDGVIL